jgi:hypothetical protein
VVESAEPDAVIEQNQIISNTLIKKNINKIHKQVFVKMRDPELVSAANKRRDARQSVASFSQLKKLRQA